MVWAALSGLYLKALYVPTAFWDYIYYTCKGIRTPEHRARSTYYLYALYWVQRELFIERKSKKEKAQEDL